eukprot:540236-Alexandrium_andersonii.AAC.1
MSLLLWAIVLGRGALLSKNKLKLGHTPEHSKPCCMLKSSVFSLSWPGRVSTPSQNASGQAPD